MMSDGCREDQSADVADVSPSWTRNWKIRGKCSNSNLPVPTQGPAAQPRAYNRALAAKFLEELLWSLVALEAKFALLFAFAAFVCQLVCHL